MTSPKFYLVTYPHVFAIEDDGYMFGAYTHDDGTPDWSTSYDFNPNDEDVDHVAHMCQLLQQAQALTIEQNNEVYVK